MHSEPLSREKTSKGTGEVKSTGPKIEGRKSVLKQKKSERGCADESKPRGSRPKKARARKASSLYRRKEGPLI